MIDRALADRRTDCVNIHTARPGCFLCRAKPGQGVDGVILPERMPL